MRGLFYITILSVVFLSTETAAQQQEETVNSKQTCEKVEVEQALDIIEISTNEVLSGKARTTSLDFFMMNEDDLRYWLGQFEFTPEVLKQTSKEEFYSKIKGWADQAKYMFLSGIEGREKVQLVDYALKKDDTPGLRINKSINAIIYLFENGQPADELTVTLLECRGKWKLIKVD